MAESDITINAPALMSLDGRPTTFKDKALAYLSSLPSSKDVNAAIRALNQTGNEGYTKYLLGKLGYYDQPSESDKLTEAYNKAYEEAKQANEERYQDILQGYEDRYGRGMGYIEARNSQGQADIDTAWRAREATGTQDMVSRGLTGTTIMPTMKMGYERERQAEQRRLENDILQQKLATDASLSGDTLAFKERRGDEYPDLRSFYEMQRSLGRYGGGGYMVRRFGGTGKLGSSFRRTSGYSPFGRGSLSGGMVGLGYRSGQGRRITHPDYTTYDQAKLYSTYWNQ